MDHSPVVNCTLLSPRSADCVFLNTRARARRERERDTLEDKTRERERVKVRYALDVYKRQGLIGNLQPAGTR